MMKTFRTVSDLSQPKTKTLNVKVKKAIVSRISQACRTNIMTLMLEMELQILYHLGFLLCSIKFVPCYFTIFLFHNGIVYFVPLNQFSLILLGPPNKSVLILREQSLLRFLNNVGSLKILRTFRAD